MYKRTRTFDRRQVKNLISIDIFEQLIKVCPQSLLLILNYLIFMESRFEIVTSSQTKIGERGGVGRRQASRLLFILESKGIINSFLRGMGPNNKKTNRYILSSIFCNYEFQQKFTKYLPALKGFCPRLVLAASMQLSLEQVRFISGSSRSNVTQVINNNIHTKSLAKAPVILPTTDTDCHKKRDVVMELRPPSQAIQQLTCFKLTKGGMVTLSAFTDEVITAAAEKMKGLRGLREPFRYFYKLCKDISSSLNQQPNYSTANRMISAMGLDPFGEMIEPGSFNSQSAVSSKDKPTNQQQPWKGYRSCQDQVCRSSSRYCPDENHPLVTKEWSREQFNVFLAKKDSVLQELSAQYGEQRAQQAWNMVTCIGYQAHGNLDKSEDLNIMQEKQGAKTLREIIYESQGALQKGAVDRNGSFLDPID